MPTNGFGMFYVDRFSAPRTGGRKRNRSKAKAQRASRKRNR